MSTHILRSRSLRTYADVLATNSGRLEPENLPSVLERLSSEIQKGRYRGVALVEFVGVRMPHGELLAKRICVECKELSSGKTRQVPYATFVQNYQFVASDPAMI